MQVAIRLVVSVVLIYFVRQETGWATATAIALIMLGSEMSSYAIRNILKSISVPPVTNTESDV